VAPKKRRLLLKVVLVAFCALVLLVLLLPYGLSLGFLKSKVTTAVNTNLRGECEVEDVSFSWFSGLSIKGVRVENPPEYPSDRPAIAMESMSADVSIGSLLFGTFLADAEIVGLEINVEQNADGTTNLQDLLPESESRSSEGPEAPEPNEPGGRRPRGEPNDDDAGLGFNFNLRDCAVTIRREGKILESLTDFNCEARSATDESDIHIDAGGKLLAGDLALKVHVDPTAETTDANLVTHGLNLNNWRPLLDAFMPDQFTALTGTANGEISCAMHGDDKVELSGDLVIDGPRVAGPVVQDMDLSAKQWKITPVLALGDAATEIDASKFVIDLEWLHLKGKAPTKPGHVTLGYDLDVARLADFGGPIPELLKGSGSRLDGVITLPSNELPADAAGWITALITNADLKVKTLDLAGFKLSDVGLNIAMQDGALTLKTSESSKLDGGALIADISVDLNNLGSIPTSATLKWSGGKLTGGATETLRYVVPLFAGLDASAAQIIGDVNLDLNVTGPAMLKDGQSLLEWLDAWSGDGSIGLENTAFAPSKQLQGLLSPLGALSKGATPIADKGKLKVDGFSTPFSFNKGVVTSTGAKWSAAGQDIGLAGKAKFDGGMDYTIDFSGLLKGHKDGEKVLKALKGNLPKASLKGTVDDPSLGLPKLENIASQLLESQGKDLLKKGLNSLFKKKK